jgi:Protein of unknown function (DUF3237)
MRQIVWLSSLALAAASSLGQAQETAGNRWPITDVAAPTTELALELYVTLSPRVEVGESDDGVRQFIPITGGRFSGAGIRGEVMPGGADWQTRRRDGVVEVNALYSIRTDDGAVIVVDNRGIIVPPPPAAVGGAAAPAAGYVRTSPRFHAPQGKYDWLNKTVFIGTITPATGGGAVIIRAFRVR